MRLSLLTVLVPLVAGYVIPDPKVAYQLVLDLAKDTQIGGSEQAAQEEINPLTKAFEDAAEIRKEKGRETEEAPRTPWEAFAAGEWALSKAVEDLEDWVGELKRGRRGKKHHRGGGHHGGHGGHGKHPKHGHQDDHDNDHDYDDDHHHHHGDGGHHHHGDGGHHGGHDGNHHHHDESARPPSLHDILHHGFYNDRDKSPHSQPHADHGHDGLSGHRPFDSIPTPHRDGHYHSNATIWDLVKSCSETSIFASFAKNDTMFLNLLKDPHQNVTVFVPSNEAFKRLFKYGILPEHGIDKEKLSKILNYHSVVGTHVGEDLRLHNTLVSRLQDDHLGKRMHQRLRLGLDQVHGPSANFFSDILLTDVLAKNGVIHGVSAVLLPPPSISDILELLPTEFSTTTAALYRTGLINDLPDLFGQGLTVFAPSNRDWDKLGWRATTYLFSEHGKEYLKAILKYHIVPRHTLYSDALDCPEHHKEHDKDSRDDSVELLPGYTHLQLPTLLKDSELSVDITRYDRFLSFRVNGFNEIIISDGIAKDGVLQVPNHVLLPPVRYHGGHGKEEFGLLQAQENVFKAQKEGREVEVEELKKLLEPYVEKLGDNGENGAGEEEL